MEISVVVPVYNVDKCLSSCIESILAQDFIDFELLLIDDGSTDLSFSICQNYALKDKRIKVFTQPNRGVSVARNLGIKMAQGKYVCFIDSDDWVEKNYLSNFILNSSKSSDFVIQGMYFDSESKSELRMLKTAYYSKLHFISCFYDNDLFRYGTPCCKLFRIDILRKYNILFPENISFGEDTLFFMYYLQYIETICTISQIAYHYRIQNSYSLSHIKHNSEKLLQFYMEYYKIVEKLFFRERTRNDNRFFIFYNEQINGISTAILNMFRHHYIYSTRKKNYRCILDFYRNKYILFEGLSYFRKIIVWILCINNIKVVDMLFHFIYLLRMMCPNYLNPFYK